METNGAIDILLSVTHTTTDFNGCGLHRQTVLFESRSVQRATAIDGSRERGARGG